MAMKGIKTRPLAANLYRNYLQKADEFFEMAKGAHERGKWNASVSNAVHAGISAADAVTTFFLQERSAGSEHSQIFQLLSRLQLRAEERKQFDHLQRLLAAKNKAEYEETLLRQKDAEASLLDAERFIRWARQKLGER